MLLDQAGGGQLFIINLKVWLKFFNKSHSREKITPTLIKHNFPGNISGEEWCASQEGVVNNPGCYKIYDSETNEKWDCKKDKPPKGENMVVKCLTPADPDLEE